MALAGVSGNVHVLLAGIRQHGRCAWTRDDAILGTAAQAVNLSRASGGERHMTPVLTACVAPPRSLLLSRPLAYSQERYVSEENSARIS